VLGKRSHNDRPPSEQDFLLIDNDGEYVCEHATLWIAKGGVAEAADAAVAEISGRLPVQEFPAAAARQTHDNIGVFGRALWLLSVQCGCAG
jgi:hypothetical protein